MKAIGCWVSSCCWNLFYWYTWRFIWVNHGVCFCSVAKRVFQIKSIKFALTYNGMTRKINTKLARSRLCLSNIYTYGFFVVGGVASDVSHLSAHLGLVLAENPLRYPIGRLGVVAHKMRVNKIYAEPIQLIRHVFIARPDQVIAKISHFTKRAEKFSGCEAVDLLHPLLRTF